MPSIGWLLLIVASASLTLGGFGAHRAQASEGDAPLFLTPSERSCDAVSALYQYLEENSEEFQYDGGRSNILDALTTDLAKVVRYECFAELTPDPELLPEAGDLVDRMEVLSRGAPPEFQSATFQCIGDFEKCRAFYKGKAWIDYEFGCGVSYCICVGAIIGGVLRR